MRRKCRLPHGVGRTVVLLCALGGLVVWPGGAAAAGSAAGESASLLDLRTYVYPVIEAPAAAGVSWCLASNPGCDEAGWWQERSSTTQADLAQFSFLEPGLASEQRYTEAVRLLWLWPEGQSLLHEAARHGVAVVSWPESRSGDALGSYAPRYRLVRINGRFAGAPTWMVAGVLAHELKHAADDRAGTLLVEEPSDCLSAELAAFGAEGRFLDWLADRQHGLPSVSQALGSLSADDLNLYANLLSATNLPRLETVLPEAYADECGTDTPDEMS